MALTMDTTCLYSVVKNLSGVTKKFPVLPPHGVELDANEEYSIFGSVLEAVNRGDRFGRTAMDSLEALLDSGDLEIRTLPKPILTDETSGDVKVVELDTTLQLSDPCWEQSLSA